VNVSPCNTASNVPDVATRDTETSGDLTARAYGGADGAHVGFGELRETVPFPAGVPSAHHSVADVIRVGTKLKVRRLAASGVVALVAD
jgi:hypothetical protein